MVYLGKAPVFQSRIGTAEKTKEVYNIDNTKLNNEMVSEITSADPSRILKFFTENMGLCSSLRDDKKNTPVHLIVLVEDSKMTQQQKIDIISKIMFPPHNVGIDGFNSDNETPLHLAVKRQYEQVTGFLIDNGADKNKINNRHQNALHIALSTHIVPCHKQFSPDPIIKVDNMVEDKNTMYNEILSVIYNNRDPELNRYMERLLEQLNNIDRYYSEHKKMMMVRITDNGIAIDDTKIDKELKTIQSKMVELTTDKTKSISTIKKEINFHVRNTVGKVKAEYEEFISGSLKPVNIDEREGLRPNENNVLSILDNLLFVKYKDQKLRYDLFIDKMKEETLDKIYDDIDKILKVLWRDYNLERKKIRGNARGGIDLMIGELIDFLVRQVADAAIEFMANKIPPILLQNGLINAGDQENVFNCVRDFFRRPVGSPLAGIGDDIYTLLVNKMNADWNDVALKSDLNNILVVLETILISNVGNTPGPPGAAIAVVIPYIALSDQPQPAPLLPGYTGLTDYIYNILPGPKQIPVNTGEIILIIIPNAINAARDAFRQGIRLPKAPAQTKEVAKFRDFIQNPIPPHPKVKANDQLPLRDTVITEITHAICWEIYNTDLYKNLYELTAPPAPPHRDEIKKRIVNYYNTLITQLIRLSSENNFESNAATEINKLLNEHIKNLNTFLAIDNITPRLEINIITQNNINIYNTPIMHYIDANNPFLPSFILVRNAPNYQAEYYDRTQPNPQVFLVPALHNPVIRPLALANIQTIGFVPNSFTDISDVDYMRLYKLKFMRDIIFRIMQEDPLGLPLPGPPQAPNVPGPQGAGPPAGSFNTIYTSIRDIFIKYNKKTSDDNRQLEMILTLVKIFDNIYINTIKTYLYLKSLEKVKSVFKNLDDFQPQVLPKNALYKAAAKRKAPPNDILPEQDQHLTDRIVKFLTMIIDQTNVSLKLDKRINEMVLYYTPNPTHDHFNVIFPQPPPNPSILMIDTKNIKRPNLTTDPEDFVEYYPPDYNSMTNISVRECIYSKKSVLDNLFAKGSPDYFKKDMTGNSAIYYAITAGNYQAIKNILDKLNAANLKYSLQNQLNTFKKSPISYSYEQLRNILKDIPNYQHLNETFINRLLLSSDIHNNIPQSYYIDNTGAYAKHGYYNLYKMLVYHLKQFILQTLNGAIYPLPFRQLWTQTANGKSVFDHRNNYAINELQFYPGAPITDDDLKLTLPTFDSINRLLEPTNKVDQYIVASKNIKDHVKKLRNDKNANILQVIIGLDVLKDIMDKKHQNKMLYRYSINSRPSNLADILNPANNFIEDTNKYCLLQIVMGIISIKDLLQTYYLQLIKKLYYTTNLFNYKNDLPTGDDIFVQELTRFKDPPNNNKINPYIPKQPLKVKPALPAPLKQPAANQWTVIDDIIQVIINSQLDDNIFNLVRTYYNIKLDIYDKDTSSETSIDEYMTNLLSELIQNGIVMPDSEMYVNINQHINKHMIELIDQTLQYNQIIIDTYHRWFINFYNQLKTFDCLTYEREND
jgi:hypothetical protein